MAEGTAVDDQIIAVAATGSQQQETMKQDRDDTSSQASCDGAFLGAFGSKENKKGKLKGEEQCNGFLLKTWRKG